LQVRLIIVLRDDQEIMIDDTKSKHLNSIVCVGRSYYKNGSSSSGSGSRFGSVDVSVC
jgi:hypothetical protein